MNRMLGTDIFRQTLDRNKRMALNRRCVIISFAVYLVLITQLILGSSSWYFRVIESAKMYYFPNGKTTTHRIWKMDDIRKYLEADILQKWILHPTLGHAQTVGMPRIRLIHTKNDSCAYPVEDRICFDKIDFNKDTFTQVEQEKEWFRPNVEHAHCLARVPLETMEPRYVEDAKVSDVYSITCYRCVYPQNGHVMDLPKPVLTEETLDHFKSMCLLRLVRRLMDFYVDPSTRFMQFEFLVYDDPSDLYILITFAFEGLEAMYWWPNFRFEPIYIRGMLLRGNYHGFEDDLHVWISPVLISLMMVVKAATVFQLLLSNDGAFSRHSFDLIVCGVSLIICTLKIYWAVKAVNDFEELLNNAYEYAPATIQKNLNSLHDRAAYMRSRQAHFPIASFVKYNQLINAANICLSILLLFQFMLYEDYIVKIVTICIISVRNCIRNIVYLICTYMAFALIAQVLLSHCSYTFTDWSSSLFTVFDFSVILWNADVLYDCEQLGTVALTIIFPLILFYQIIYFISATMAELAKLRELEKSRKVPREDNVKTVMPDIESKVCLSLLHTYLKK